MFDTKELTAQLNAGQIKIPDNHRVALVVHVDPLTGDTSATVATNLGKGWQVGNTFEWTEEKGFQDGFNISFSK